MMLTHIPLSGLCLCQQVKCEHCIDESNDSKKKHRVESWGCDYLNVWCSPDKNTRYEVRYGNIDHIYDNIVSDNYRPYSIETNPFMLAVSTQCPYYKKFCLMAKLRNI